MWASIKALQPEVIVALGLSAMPLLYATAIAADEDKHTVQILMIRSKRKQHNQKKWVEGKMSNPGARAVFINDFFADADTLSVVEQALSADTALRLSRVFTNTSAAFWMNLQSAHELSTAEIETADALDDIESALGSRRGVGDDCIVVGPVADEGHHGIVEGRSDDLTPLAWGRDRLAARVEQLEVAVLRPEVQARVVLLVLQQLLVLLERFAVFAGLVIPQRAGRRTHRDACRHEQRQAGGNFAV